MDICLENAEICDDNNFDEEATYLRKEQMLTETVLNLIEKQQTEIEKKDNIIALMAEQLTTPIHSKEWVIEYYTKEVEEK